MSRITLRDHIQRLRERDSLHVVSRQVDPKHELAAVTKAVQQATNDAVIFENVIGTRHPVVTNLYNDRDRLCSIIDAGANNFCSRWNFDWWCNCYRVWVQYSFYNYVFLRYCSVYWSLSSATKSLVVSQHIYLTASSLAL